MNKNENTLKVENFLNQGDSKEVISMLSEIIEKNPESSISTYLELAQAFESNSQFEDSLSVYEKVLEINSAHLIARAKIAKIKLDQEKVQEALEAYDEAMAIANPNPPLWLCNAWQKALRKTGNIEKAITYYKNALRLQPENFLVRIQLSSIYKHEGKKCLPAFLVQKKLFENRSNPLKIFDVGANIGETAQDYAGLFSDSSIHCFEPTPDIFVQLNENLEKDCLENFKTHQLAISDKCDVVKFYLHSDERLIGLNSLLQGESNSDAISQDSEFIEVPATTIDLFCENQNIEAIDILKFDIQGGELIALNGAKRMLEANAIGLVYSEVHFGKPIYDNQAMFSDIGKFLQDYGFFLYDIYPRYSYFLGNLTWGDAIFIGPPLIRELEAKGLWR